MNIKRIAAVYYNGNNLACLGSNTVANENFEGVKNDPGGK